MSWSENKLWISFGLGLAVVFTAFFSLLRPTQGERFEDKDIIYEMARPQSFTPAEYDLSQREIERQYNNPFEKIEEGNKANKLVQGKNNSKKTDNKKKQNSNSTAQKQKQKDKAKSTDPRIVDGGKKSLTPSENFENREGLVTQYFDPQQNQKNEEKDPKKEDPDDRRKDQRSADQWNALLLAEPTYANMKNLIRAYSEKEIDSGSYYRILQGLIESRSPQAQMVGLYGAQAFPSVQSFTFIAKNEASLSGNSKSFSEQILLAYNQAQNVMILGEVLKSSEEAVVMRAGDIIMIGIQKYKNGESILEANRTSRGDTRMQSASQYANLIPILQQLAASQSPTVVQLAANVLGQIQSLKI